MQNTNASKTIEQLNRLFLMYGYPEQVVTDNGPQFVAQDLCSHVESSTSLVHHIIPPPMD